MQESTIWAKRRESAAIKMLRAERMLKFFNDPFLKREAEYYSRIADMAELMELSATNENQDTSLHRSGRQHPEN